MILFLKNLLFTVVLPASVAVYVPLLIVRGQSPFYGPAESRPAPGMAVLGIATLFFVIGAAIYTWCVRDFAVSGRGTPAPIDAPKRLVVRGLYRYTRNPMYLGVLCAILGWLVLYPSLVLVAYLIAICTCFHLFVVLYEERHLRRVFGNQYQEYCQKVNRWLPRIWRRRD